MEAREKEGLIKQLQSLQFPASLANQMDDYDEIGNALIPLKYRIVYGDEVANYSVYVRYNSLSEELEIPRFDLSLRKNLTIPEKIIHGINVRELDLAMTDEDWWSEEDQNRKISLMEQMFDFSQNNHPSGIDVMEKLILKHLADTSYSEGIENLELIRAKHEHQRTFASSSPVRFNAWQAYNLMAGRPVAIEIIQDGEKITKWFQLDNLAKDFAGITVVTELEGRERFNLAKELSRMPNLVFEGEEEKLRVMNDLSNGGFALVTTKLPDNGTETRILTADLSLGKIKYAWKEMRRLGLDKEFTQDEAIDHLPKEDEHIVQRLLKELGSLGFEVGTAERSFREALYHRDQQVVITHQQKFGGDSVRYKIQFDRTAEERDFVIASFTATLRREIIIPDDFIVGINTSELQKRFREIEWEKQNWLEPNERKERLLDIVESPIQKKTDVIWEDLQKIGDISPLLQSLFELKFLADTPQEEYCKFLQDAKNRTEIRCEFDPNSDLAVNAKQAYELLNGQIVERALPYEEDKILKLPGYLEMYEGVEGNRIKWQMGFSEKELISLFNYVGNPHATGLPKELHFFHDFLRGQSHILPMIENGRIEKRLVSFDWRTTQLSVQRKPAQEALSLNHPESLIKHLLPQLHHIGFEQHEKYLSRGLRNEIFSFELQKQLQYGNDRGLYTLGIGVSADKQRLELQTLHASLLKDIIVPSIQIGGIDTGDLEDQMRKIPWDNQDYWQLGKDPHDVTYPGHWTDSIIAHEVFENLGRLYENEDPRGKWTAEALATKYLSFTPNEYFLNDLVEFKHSYLIDHRFDLKDLPDLTLDQAYNLMEGRSVYLGPGKTGKEQWMKIDFSSALGGKLSNLEKFQPEKAFDIPRLMEVLYKAYEDDLESINKFLRNGDVATLPIRYEGSHFQLEFYADPKNNQMKFTNLDNSSDLGSYLSGQRGWKYNNIDFIELGQIRDFNTHPILNFNNKLFVELSSQVEAIGFGKDHHEELFYKLNSGYPKFEIVHNDLMGKETFHSALHFEQDKEPGSVDLKSYTITLLDQECNPKIELFINLHDKGNDLPIFNYKESINLTRSRFIYKEHQESAEVSAHWYGIGDTNTNPPQPNSVKTFDFSLHEVKAALHSMQVLELQNPPMLEECLAVLKRGEPFPSLLISGTLVIPGFISVHPDKRRTEFKIADNWKGKVLEFPAPHLFNKDLEDDHRRRFRPGGL